MLKVETDKPRLKVKMQSVSDDAIRKRLLLADRTATQYDQLLAESRRPSVCL